MTGWKHWTDEELNILAKSYPTVGAADISKMTGRSIEAIRTKAKDLNIKMETRGGRYRKAIIKWTEPEIEAIQKFYPEHGSIYIIKMFPHRTKQAVQQEASKRGIARFALLRPRKAKKIAMPKKDAKNTDKGGAFDIVQRIIPAGQWVSDIPKVRSVFDLGGCA